MECWVWIGAAFTAGIGVGVFGMVAYALIR